MWRRDDPSSDRVRPTIEPEREIDPVGTLSASPSFADHERVKGPTSSAELRVPDYKQVRNPDRYRIIGEHGRGGLGCVSRARDQDLGRDVAIKELLARNPMGEVRFVREALITARLEHPGIVPVYEAGRWPNGTPFYAMKLVAGRSLRDLIAERATVAQRIGLLHHVIAVADALAYAHDRNIIHRDLKPGNVIVGNFGETIVIDWGLAKDLGAPADELTAGSAVQRERSAGMDLTLTGSVMGTPAYMAPEQARGELVDQRADVFAIGAMLWELCALSRVPPTDAGDRHRMLRRAGIDRDLSTIVGKALDPDPRRRYPHAGALAEDLRAFKSGARISARSYSLFGMLAHWTLRHRGLALGTAIAVVLALLGSALYVVNIAVERDRVDTALGRAQASNDELTLKNAELVLRGDPTAAAAMLAAYRGDQLVRRDRLLAEAVGRGVADATIQPHAATIRFLLEQQDGAIVSIANDRQVRITRNGASQTIASDVSTDVRTAYAPATQRLAYAAIPSGISVLELTTLKSQRITTTDPVTLSFDQSGARLLALDDKGVLTVWSVSPAVTKLHQETLEGAYWAEFASAARVIVMRPALTSMVEVDGHADMSHEFRGPTAMAMAATNDAIVIGDDHGEISLLSPELVRSQRVSVCGTRLHTLEFVAHSQLLLFSCHDGLVGLMEVASGARSMQLVDSFHAQGVTNAVADVSGRYLVAWGKIKDVAVYDVKTRLLSTYEGQSGEVAFVTAPTRGDGHILVGDVSGTVRIWTAPVRASTLLLRVSHPLYHLGFLDRDRLAVAGGNLVTLVDRSSGAALDLQGHLRTVIRVRVSPDGRGLLSYGYDRMIRAWRVTPTSAATARVFEGHSDSIESAEYIEGGRRVVSIGDDGRLLVWTPDGTDAIELFASPTPLVALAVVAWNDHAVVADRVGAIWDVSPRGEVVQVRTSHGGAAVIRASKDGRLLAIGDDDGVVGVYEARTWTLVKRLVTGVRAEQLQFDPAGRELLVISADKHVRVLALDSRRVLPWSDLAAGALDIAYNSDGSVIALLCADGGEWFYRVPDSVWVYVRDHRARVTSGRFSSGGADFVSVDDQGAVIVRDIKSTFDMARAGLKTRSRS